MFTQFFGNFLLNDNYVNREQLIQGLQAKSNTRMKLGILAINSGYMTASQVEKLHLMQFHQNKRIGGLAVEMGYMTTEQVEELLNSQIAGYLLLGQALVDLEFLSNTDFEKAIASYKSKYSLTDSDIDNASEDKIAKMIQTFCDFSSSSNDSLYSIFISLLINNLVRFVGDDFVILEPIHSLNQSDNLYISTQSIRGKLNTTTALVTDDKTLIAFASRYAGEELTEIDEYVTSSACDFLNLNNGLFTVNVSNDYQIELSLTPPETTKYTDNSILDNSFILPVSYPFGIINFVITL